MPKITITFHPNPNQTNGDCAPLSEDLCAQLLIKFDPAKDAESSTSGKDNKHCDEPCDCKSKAHTTQDHGDHGTYHKEGQPLILGMRGGYLSTIQEGKMCADLFVGVQPDHGGTKPEIYILDDTCGPSPVHGGGVKQKPRYDSKTCEQIRCERERKKQSEHPCLILNLRTGNPRERNPKYCTPPDCSRIVNFL